MPYLPKSKRRPWLPEPTRKEQKQVIEKRYHTHRWRLVSKLFIQENPLCVSCLEKGVVKESRVTDHKVRVKDGADFWDSTNYQALCDQCHNRKRAKERWG
jgi:5-methylcytosine-specific restriction enzyme A